MRGEGENILIYAQSNRPKYDLLTILLALLLGVTVAGPTAAATEFSVAGVGVEAVPAAYVGTCPGVITFKAKMQANAAGRVKYTWIRSDGATGPVEYIDFVEPGVLHVETTWTLGDVSILPRYEGWEQIKILSPAEMVSNKATFTLKCKRSKKNQSDNNIQPTAWAGKGDFAQARALRPGRRPRPSWCGTAPAGTGDDADFSDSILLSSDQTLVAGSLCSRWTSGIWPSGCFSHDMQNSSMQSATALRPQRRRRAIMRWHSYQPLRGRARLKRDGSTGILPVGPAGFQPAEDL